MKFKFILLIILTESPAIPEIPEKLIPTNKRSRLVYVGCGVGGMGQNNKSDTTCQSLHAQSSTFACRLRICSLISIVYCYPIVGAHNIVTNK